MSIDDHDLAQFLHYADRERALAQDERERALLGLPPLTEAYERLRYRNRLVLYAATRREHAGYRIRLKIGRRSPDVRNAQPTVLVETRFELDGQTATFTIVRN